MPVVVERYVMMRLDIPPLSRDVHLIVPLLHTRIIGQPVVMEALGVSVTVIRPHLPPRP